MDFLNKVSENWLKWISLPFAFLLDVSLYVFAASELNDLPNVVLGGREYLLLAIPFLLLLIAYVVCCCVHNSKKKREESQQEENPQEQKPKASGRKKAVWVILSGCFLAVTISVLVLMFSAPGGFQDGNYVIWAQQYHVALSPQVHKSYYLEGDPIQAMGDKLTDYPQRCVLQLDFKGDGTFTISCNGELLGVAPGKNGVGYGGQCSCIRWELVEAEENVYYIRNVSENTYLKWYDAQGNWTSHPNIVEDNKEQYLLHLDRVE